MISRELVNSDNEQNFSKFLSFILRHKPEEIGLTLQENGWVDTNKLLKAINTHANSNWLVYMQGLEVVVNNDKKGRYSFNEDKTLIRANQGHSIKDLKMEFKEVTPPKYLYHGTSEETVKKIFNSGELKPMSRQMVHLSKDIETATNVGKRHGKPSILVIDTESAVKDGIKFYISENGVYLVDKLSTNYIKNITY